MSFSFNKFSHLKKLDFLVTMKSNWNDGKTYIHYSKVYNIGREWFLIINSKILQAVIYFQKLKISKAKTCVIIKVIYPETLDNWNQLLLSIRVTDQNLLGLKRTFLWYSKKKDLLCCKILLGIWPKLINWCLPCMPFSFNFTFLLLF